VLYSIDKILFIFVHEETIGEGRTGQAEDNGVFDRIWIEELLDRVYTLLTSFGYEVWMSHKGSVPVFSNRTAFENCLQAVKNCDLFLGIITPNYGSG
jgi:hypothetical protein